MSPTRRSVLQASGGAAAMATVAGCVDGFFESPDADGYAAFFALWDWAEHVAGETLTFENPVETGMLGHGWDPDGNILPDIVSTDVFVYLDTREFAWAVDAAQTIRSDHSDEVALIDGFDGLESDLLPFDGRESGSERDTGETDPVNDTNSSYDHGHDDEAVGHIDPHAWVDPVLARRMVETIADELATLDPPNAATYSENAESYGAELQDVHDQFDQVVSDAPLDIAIFAGHNSYQYLEHRYDFEIVTPIGVAPDEEVTSGDIGRLVSLAEEHSMGTVLYDPFESAQPGEDRPELVDVLMDETTIENAAPLTSAAATTPEWNDANWGWVEQMEKVTIPSLEQALNPA